MQCSATDLTLSDSDDPAGGIVSHTSSNDNYAWAGHYAINRGYTANGLNQHTAVGGITPTYDSRGNVTSAGSTTYGYSSENRLTSASGGVTLSYDPLGRLSETVGASTTRMAYDGDQLIAEYNGSNALQRRYVYGPGTGGTGDDDANHNINIAGGARARRLSRGGKARGHARGGHRDCARPGGQHSRERSERYASGRERWRFNLDR